MERTEQRHTSSGGRRGPRAGVQRRGGVLPLYALRPLLRPSSSPDLAYLTKRWSDPGREGATQEALINNPYNNSLEGGRLATGWRRRGRALAILAFELLSCGVSPHLPAGTQLFITY